MKLGLLEGRFQTDVARTRIPGSDEGSESLSIFLDPLVSFFKSDVIFFLHPFSTNEFFSGMISGS